MQECPTGLLAADCGKMLYRGVDKRTDAANGGRLLPRSAKVEVVPLFDGRWKYDGAMIAGPSQSNTARAHQLDTGLYGGCGVSTSRSEHVAVKFATGAGIEDGFVYVIDEAKLANANVAAWEFTDAVEPQEQEVTLIPLDGKALSPLIVVEKYEVNSDGQIVARDLLHSK
jgi:hypothetical protein